MEIAKRLVVGILTSMFLCLQAWAADLKVGMVTSLSGPASSLGIPYANGVRAGLAYMPEIGGRKVQLLVLDDASDPTAAARGARKLILDEKVDLLIGAAGVPSTLAVAGVGREGLTPMIAISPIALSGPDGAWVVTVVQPVPLMISAVVDHMKDAGVRSVAFIGFADAAGDLFYDALVESAASARIKVLANERYARSDSSVMGQILKIVAQRPDAVLDGGTGTPGALPLLTLAGRNYTGRIYGTHGLINADFIRVVGRAGQGLMAPTGPVIVADQLPVDDPMRKMSLEYRAAYQHSIGEIPADAFSAYSFDAWLVFADAAKRALSKVEPGTEAFRLALRDAIVTGKDVVGTHGVYNFRPDSRYGVDERARVMVTLDEGKWKLATP